MAGIFTGQLFVIILLCGTLRRFGEKQKHWPNS